VRDGTPQGRRSRFAAAVAAGTFVTAGVAIALKALRRTAPAKATKSATDTSGTRQKVPVIG
jgi:hypothetical protein